MDNLVEIRNIRKIFPVKSGGFKPAGDLRAVDGVDLHIRRGENISLVGESGCGKTTLARILMRLMPLNAGQIMFEGRNITHLAGRRMLPYRRKMQMVFQDPFTSLDPRFTIRRILSEAMHFEKKWTRNEREERIKALLDLVWMPDNILQRYPHEFSGGERQRIAIARALAVDPQLIILDEAVSSLDVLVQEQILRLLKELQEKMEVTFLFISHNLRVVKKISHRIAVMYRGRIVELAQTADVFQNPQHPYTRGLLRAAMEYELPDETGPIELSSGAALVDIGDGHMVLR